MISSELLERDIIDFDGVHEKFFNKYFIEKNEENVKYFIYCNDDGNNEDNVDYYNKTTLKYIKKCMRIEIINHTNIIKNLIKHIKEISSSVLKEEIKSIELSKEKDLITCTNVIKPKEILYDGPNDIIFLGKEFEPMYRYYAKEKEFIFEIDLCSKYYSLIVKHKLDKTTKETKFTIISERVIEEFTNEGNKILVMVQKKYPRVRTSGVRKREL